MNKMDPNWTQIGGLVLLLGNSVYDSNFAVQGWSSFWEIQCMIQTLRCRGGILNSFCNIWNGYKRVRNLHGGGTPRRTD